MYGQEGILARLSVMPELPEPRSPGFPIPAASVSPPMTGPRALPRPPVSATLRERFVVRPMTFSIANPDRSTISDSSSESSVPSRLPTPEPSVSATALRAAPNFQPFNYLPSELPAQRISTPPPLPPKPRASTPELRIPTPPPQLPRKPFTQPLLIIPSRSYDQTGESKARPTSAPLSALSALTPANLQGLPGATPPQAFLMMDPHGES